MTAENVLEHLNFARRVVEHANRSGLPSTATGRHSEAYHLGAVLADAVLQAGLNYRTVVKARVTRIHEHFPEAAHMTGLIAIIERGEAADFLNWNHPTKVSRFVSLAQYLATQEIETTTQLNTWLRSGESRCKLLGLPGIGPKTYDYLGCLVGIDWIAVDRHIRTFVEEAGVPINDYDTVKLVASYAADLLGIRRRDFDAWIWNEISTRSSPNTQLPLL